MNKQRIRIMTYNVRRCTGLDGRVRPERIASIISHFNPDVVALQEVDVNRKRTAFENQPERLATLTGMTSFFFPRITEGTEQYGIAVLSKLPVEDVKMGRLPTQYVPQKPEVGGVIAVRLNVNGSPLRLIATHFDHNFQERLLHIQTLIGPEWVNDPESTAPVVLCGDLNTAHRSDIYIQVNKKMKDAQGLTGNYLKTWPSFFPLFRIDHIFVSHQVGVAHALAPRTPQTRIASDHLPLIADLTF